MRLFYSAGDPAIGLVASNGCDAPKIGCELVFRKKKAQFSSIPADSRLHWGRTRKGESNRSHSPPPKQPQPTNGASTHPRSKGGGSMKDGDAALLRQHMERIVVQPVPPM